MSDIRAMLKENGRGYLSPDERLKHTSVLEELAGLEKDRKNLYRILKIERRWLKNELNDEDAMDQIENIQREIDDEAENKGE